MRRTDRSLLCAIVAVVAAVALPASAAAQRFDADFLFGEPDATLTFRGGLAFANAGSDLFKETRELFTLDGRDFNGFTLGVDLGVPITSRLDFVVGAGIAHAGADSEYRDFVDLEDRPIEQRTRFTRVPLTVGVKAYVTPRGQSIGRFVWIPEKAAAWIGGGVGTMWYRFAQEGDFVDFDTFDIVSDRLSSSGFTPTAYAAVGGELTLSERFALAADARYSWASTELDPLAFSGYEPIDLAGLSTTVGFLVRF